MLLSVLALLAAAAAPVGAAPENAAPHTPVVRARLLVTEANGTAGRDVKGLVARELAAELSRYPSLEVLAWGDLRRMMELESARQLTACDEAKMSSCLADLQSALGVPWAVFVDVDEVGGLTSIGLALVAADGTALSRQTLQVTDLQTLHDALGPAVRALVTPLHAAVAAPLPPDASDVQSPLPWAVVGVGGVVALGGTAMLLVGAQPWLGHDSARADVAALRQRSNDDPASTALLLPEVEVAQARQRDARDDWESFGQGLVVVGAVALVAGVAAVGGGLAWGRSE